MIAQLPNRRIARTLCILLAVFATVELRAQTNISGVINSYQRVTGISPKKVALRVPSTAAFAAGDRVLVIQMKGAAVTITTTGTTSGVISGINNAGTYEYNTIVGKSADSLFLAGPLCRPYSVPDSVQVVRVPVYTGNVTVTGPLTATPWPTAAGGGAGGIIAFEVGGTLTLAAGIDASAAGFRGGVITTGNSFICNSSTINSSGSADGRKGEGVAIPPAGSTNSRGRLANGGGGSGAGNTGAGGGANWGAGGDGGKEFVGYCQGTVFSYGGQGLSGVAAPDRAFFGGGGGGPQKDNFGTTVFPGGAGGGIIFIKATSIAGGGQAIRANGEDVTAIFDSEGGSGGGAGGTIHLDCTSYSGTLTVEAKGGFGASNFNQSSTGFPNDCHGPGGGGGGGLIRFGTAATPAGVTTDVTGGDAGEVTNPSAQCYVNDPTHGAQNGAAGTVLYNLATYSVSPLDIRDTITCTATTPLTLNIGSGYTSVLWSTGATTAQAVVPGTGVYTVEATTPFGCVLYDTARVTRDTISLGRDTTLCPGVTYTLRVRPQGNFTSFQWSTGATTPTIPVTTPGTYSVLAQSIYGCGLRDTIVISYDTVPRLRDTVLCLRGAGVTLAYPPGFQNYLWNTGATTSSITVSDPGTYTVTALTPGGCTVSDAALVEVDTMSLGPDTLLCITDAPITLKPRPAGKYLTYLWGNGSTDSVQRVDTTGVYTVTVTTRFGCTLRDTILVEIDAAPALSITLSDSVLCAGREIVFGATVAPSGLEYIAWSFGDGTDSVRNVNPVSRAFADPGTYTVSVTALYRVCRDSTVSQEVQAVGFPAIDLGPDTSLCPGGAPVHITARTGGDVPYGPVVWNTRDTAQSILARLPGVYWAQASLDGCTSSDTVIVAKDCYLDVPNVFTPNGDGLNDYFLPRQLLSAGVTAFSMQVYNRWGEKVWQTASLDGRGWDGRFGGVDQPTGVYVYLIEVTLANGRTERYGGNVTLMR